MFYNCFLKKSLLLKAVVFFVIVLSLQSLAQLSAREQYHGFLEYQKQQQTFDQIRKKGFSQYKRDFNLHQNQKNEILKYRLKQDRTDQTEKEKLAWEKAQALVNQHREASRKAYLKKRAALKEQNKKYPRPQSLPYKNPL